MPKIKNADDFKALVLKHLKSLPPQQELIAAFLLEHLEEAPFTSVPELAQRVKVSEATVVRFAQRIGYDGFASMKMDLMAALKKQVSQKANLGSLFTNYRESDTLAAAARQEMRNIDETIQQVTKEDFQRMASALFKADHIYTFGMGVSSYLAEIFAYLMVQTGMRATALTPKFSSPLEQLVPMRLTDLLVVFSFPPYSKPSVEMVAHAKKRGIPSLVLCDRITAPAAKEASHILTVRTDNMMFTNSLGALVVVLNALVTEIAVRHGDAVEAVNRINQILSEDQTLIVED